MLYAQPDFEAAFHGFVFSSLSEHPFDLSSHNPLQYRILAPLLGYLFFLRGKLFFILPLVFSVFFMSAVYFHYRKKEFSIAEALLMTSFVAFSCTLLIPLHAAGYTDPVTFFFIFLAFASVKHLFRSALFFSLALLNHESSVVLLPGLIFYSWIENKFSSGGRIKSFMAFLLFCIPFIVYRWYVSGHAEIRYNLSFYFAKENINAATLFLFHFLPAAIFYSFKLFWFFPLYFLMIMLKEKKWSEVFMVVLIFFCVVSQVIIAFDYTRMISLAFPLVLITAEKVRQWWGTEKFMHFSALLILFNFFILQYYVSSDGITALFPWFYNLFAAWCGHPNV